MLLNPHQQTPARTIPQRRATAAPTFARQLPNPDASTRHRVIRITFSRRGIRISCFPHKNKPGLSVENESPEFAAAAERLAAEFGPPRRDGQGCWWYLVPRFGDGPGCRIALRSFSGSGQPELQVTGLDRPGHTLSAPLSDRAHLEVVLVVIRAWARARPSGAGELKKIRDRSEAPRRSAADVARDARRLIEFSRRPGWGGAESEDRSSRGAAGAGGRAAGTGRRSASPDAPGP
jgi:hypothetical protein